MSEKRITKMASSKPTTGKTFGASRIPTSGRDSGTHSRSSSVSNLTTTSDTKSEAGDAAGEVATNFVIGERVWVNGTKPGFLKFVGKTQFAPGVWAGVNLDDPVGKNDGSVDGVKYFQCEPKKGIFARLHRLTREAGSPPGIGDSSVLVGSSRPQTPESSPGGAARASTIGTISHVTPKACSRLRIGERVVVNSTTGVKTGTLKYVGETEFAKGEWAGIELDQPVGKNDGSVAGKRYFNCKPKHGLFSPLHKVSHAGGSSTPRAGSIHGARLKSAGSRESLNSSISSCSTSRSNRVKLGITSLTNTQKQLRTPGIGIMTNSKALEETIKEKEQHIEQLLKERELERSEVVRATSQYEEIEKKLSVLKENEEKMSKLTNLYERAEAERKDLEGKWSNAQRKLEDLQFQLEEELVAKGDLEIQLQVKSNIMKRLEDFANTELAEKKLCRVQEILKGQDYLISEAEAELDSLEKENFAKISKLEQELQITMEEKMNLSKQLSDFEAANAKKEMLMSSLNSSVQEKDDNINKLKEELKSANEKITEILKERESLNAEVEKQKAHTEEECNVMKNIEEKNQSLSTEMKKLEQELQEKVKLIEVKDEELFDMNKSLEDQASQLSHLQSNIIESESKLKQNEEFKQALESQLSQIKVENESIVSKMQKDNSDLTKEMENLSGLLQEKNNAYTQKENEISSLEAIITNNKVVISDLNEKLSKAEETISLSKKENSDKTNTFECELQKLTEESEKLKKELQQKLQDLETKDNLIKDKETQLSSVKDQLNEKDSAFNRIEAELTELKESYQHMVKEMENSELSSKEQLRNVQTELESVVDSNQKEVQKHLDEIKRLSGLENEKNAALLEKDQANQELIKYLEEKTEKVVEVELKLRQTEEELLIMKDTCSAQNTSLSSEIAREKDKFNNMKFNFEQKLTEAVDMNTDLSSNLHKKEFELKEAKEYSNCLEEKVKQKDSQITELELSLRNIKEEIELLSKDKSEGQIALQKQLTEIRNNTDAELKEGQNKIQKLQDEIKRLSDLEAEKNNALLESNNANNQLTKSLEENREKIAQMNLKLKQTEEELQLVKENSSAQISTLTNKIACETSVFESVKSDLDQKLNKSMDMNASLCSDLQKKELELREIEEVTNTWQKQYEEKVSEASELESQLQKSQQEIDRLGKNKSEIQMALEKQVTDMRNETKAELDKKQSMIEDLKKDLAQQTELNELKAGEITKKERDILQLQNIVKEKDSQFDELKEIIQNSQDQLTQLKQQNEANLNLLHSKESLINEFKAEQEKQILHKDKLLKEENVKFQALLRGKDEDIMRLEASIMSMTANADDYKKQIEILQSEIEKSNKDKTKIIQDSDSAHKDLAAKVADLEAKYNKLFEEKEKIAKEELSTRDAKKGLEQVRDSLLQEKAQQQELVKDREEKLEALQKEIHRMKNEFLQHKFELQKKLDVSVTEVQAALELKRELEIQHSVLEELQQDLQNSEAERKKLELDCQSIPLISAEKNKLTELLETSENAIRENTNRICDMEKKNNELKKMIDDNKSLLQQKDAECYKFKQQLESLQKDAVSSEVLRASIQVLEAENLSLKNKVTNFKAPVTEPNANLITTGTEIGVDEEKESLRSQVDFLNSIIVEMKQKNEELCKKLEEQTTCWEENDFNLNDTVKQMAPRLFCDICDIFDLHDTEDCPKQSSEEVEKIPQLKVRGSKVLEERPYCNNCEVFGHWTLDCDEQDTF